MMERLRTSLRSLLATPAPVVAAILTLAVASGANLAMFGLIDRALLSPPPGIDDPGRLFTLGLQPPGDPAATGRMTTTSYVAFTEIRDEVPSVSAAAFQRVPATVMIDGDQRRVNSMLVSGEYFAVLGPAAALGRTLTPSDHERGVAIPVAVVSHAFWRSALQSDPNAIGRRLGVRSLDYEIVGVMRPGFSGHSTLDVDMWVPFAAALQATPGWDRDRFRNLVSILVRLDDDANTATAETQAAALLGRRVSLRGIVGADVTAADQRVAWWLGGVSMLVLAIGLANTGTLLVVRAARTRYDMAVRAALGASRAQLIAQSLIDALIIACAATLIAWLLSAWLDEAVRRVLFPGVVVRSGINTTAIVTAAFAGVLGFLAAAVVFVWSLPARVQVMDLAGQSPGGTRRSRTQTSLLLIQTAASGTCCSQAPPCSAAACTNCGRRISAWTWIRC